MKPLAADSPIRDRAIKDKVDPRYDRHLMAGIPLDGQGYPGERLQCRNELDRTNWLALKDICFEAISAGFGDAPIPEPGIRCNSNNFILPTFSETFALMQHVRTWAMQSQANWWRLKDLCRSAETIEDLEAIDLEEGWP